jgi:hypothetical protein
MVESTQQGEGAGKPAIPVSKEGLTDNGWSAGEASHKELMRLEDRDPVLPRAAAPNPPGETGSPPPDKDAKATGAATDKSPNQQKQPSQPAQASNKSAPNGDSGNQQAAAKAPAPPPRPVSQAKVKMQERLPALVDDGEVGQEKEQTVGRDGKADLGFKGTLLGSAASSAPKGRWQEYRVYSTSTGKHVFSKVNRSIFADENDKHEADVFDPSPTSVPSQLLRSAREMAHSRPMTWMDAAVAFFGYDPLAKVLYRKLSVDFEERV